MYHYCSKKKVTLVSVYLNIKSHKKSDRLLSLAHHPGPGFQNKPLQLPWICYNNKLWKKISLSLLGPR